MSSTPKERPILFSTPMVQAILEGRKTMTRRVVKPQPKIIHAIYSDASLETEKIFRHGDQRIHCPYGTIGDRLWVRETFGWYNGILQGSYGFVPPEKPKYPPHKLVNGQKYAICYKADYPNHRWDKNDSGWKPSIFMPRSASRITLEIVGVGVEQLQAISPDDCWKEGISEDAYNEAEHYVIGGSPVRGGAAEVCVYANLWESINGKGSWDENPWVWVIEFKKI